VRKVVIKFKSGEFVNIEADTIEISKNDIIVSNNGKIVVLAKIKEIISCHLSEQR
jgi:hypothetical protein